MKEYFGLILFLSLILLVVVRTITLKNQGIDAIEFGKKDPKDFFIPPFAFFYLYLITANAIGLPTIAEETLLNAKIVAWTGVAMCIIALIFFIWSIVSFKKSFRVGLSENSAQGLITTGAFSISRNPIYVSFAIMLTGQFLIHSGWIFLVYLFLGTVTFHRQVLKEEEFLKQQYGNEFDVYCGKVRRYL